MEYEMMQKIEITIGEYKELVEAKERIDTLKRMWKAGCYLNDKDYMSIVDFKKEDEKDA